MKNYISHSVEKEKLIFISTFLTIYDLFSFPPSLLSLFFLQYVSMNYNATAIILRKSRASYETAIINVVTKFLIVTPRK